MKALARTHTPLQKAEQDLTCHRGTESANRPPGQ